MKRELPMVSLSHMHKSVHEQNMGPSAPKNPHVHLVETDYGPHMFVVNGSRLYKIGTEEAAALEKAMAAEDLHVVNAVLTTWQMDTDPYIETDSLATPPIRSLSLAIAQTCNLACTYCYAQGGNFGGPAKSMPQDVAMAAVTRLFEDVHAGEKVTLSFLGGEPLVNRVLMRACTARAAELAREKGVDIGFSITTNGTLITLADGAFFEQYAFAVSISLDGVGELHDAQRPFKDGRGSYARILANVTPLLARQEHMQISARVTVTPRNLHLTDMLDHLIRLGFHSVGFSPMLASPQGRDEMTAQALDAMLEQMIDCGQEFERQVVGGDRYPFFNMVSAMKELYRGTHRPYPCGAGAGYMGVSADGRLWACHRFVDDENGAMGSLSGDVDRSLQNTWLLERHVDRQEPCRSCWARYLCGGGCHHEVIHRGRPACEYIRGWLHYCVQAYVRLRERRPDYFGLTE